MAVGPRALAAGNCSSSHDRSAPAQPSTSAMMSGRSRKPPRRLYMARRTINGRFLLTCLVECSGLNPSLKRKKEDRPVDHDGDFHGDSSPPRKINGGFGV